MSRFSAGFSAEAGLARATLAPLAMRRSSKSTGAEGDWSFADSDAFKSTVDGRWLRTLMSFRKTVGGVPRGTGKQPSGVGGRG